ncbi:MAG: dihydrolipoyl dehydrogenase [Candidatus Omnitrophica bacterium]|nr:dihydrolipoyl dehydrogenase [Candidatus Omnitrophota bacterium]
MFDVIIIGAGWAGFTAAIIGKKSGLKIALIEKNHVGGTCLNAGCIPTKTILQSARILEQVKSSSIFGIFSDNSFRISWETILRRKQTIIEQLRSSMEKQLLGIDFLRGYAKIISPECVEVEGKKFYSRYILIATGSTPTILDAFNFDNKKILSSDQILEINEIPSSLLIIGGGVIGCEFANIFSILGTEVTILEITDQLLPSMDNDVARKLENSFKKRRIKIKLSTDPQTINISEFDKILVCTGRRVLLPENLEKIGIRLDSNGLVLDEYLRTTVPSIYAAGDCTGQVMLAHFANFQAKIAIKNIISLENFQKITPAYVPSCVYTIPEVASVGLTEKQAIIQGIDYQIIRCDFMSSAMAKIIDEKEGFIKILFAPKTKLILGAAIIGPKATELIHLFAIAVSQQMTLPQLSKVIFAHPTLAEAISECIQKNGDN